MTSGEVPPSLLLVSGKATGPTDSDAAKKLKPILLSSFTSTHIFICVPELYLMRPIFKVVSLYGIR